MGVSANAMEGVGMRVAFSAGGLLLLTGLSALGCTPTLRGTACATDDQCAAGEACIEHTCRAVACLDDGDCPAGLCHPEAFICVGQACDDDGDCDQGAVCVQGTCEPGCGVDKDCLEGGRCEPETGPHGTCVFD